MAKDLIVQQPKRDRDITKALQSNVIFVLQTLEKIDDELFRRVLPLFYDGFVALIADKDAEVRRLLGIHFARIGGFFDLHAK